MAMQSGFTRFNRSMSVCEGSALPYRARPLNLMSEASRTSSGLPFVSTRTPTRLGAFSANIHSVSSSGSPHLGSLAMPHMEPIESVEPSLPVPPSVFSYPNPHAQVSGMGAAASSSLLYRFSDIAESEMESDSDPSSRAVGFDSAVTSGFNSGFSSGFSSAFASAVASHDDDAVELPVTRLQFSNDELISPARPARSLDDHENRLQLSVNINAAPVPFSLTSPTGGDAASLPPCKPSESPKFGSARSGKRARGRNVLQEVDLNTFTIGE
jgi:hypothetical protein